MKTIIIILLLFYCATDVFTQDRPAEKKIDESEILIADEPSGEERKDEGTSSQTLSTFSFVDIIRMVLVLAGVIIVIYLVFFFLKRTVSPRFQPNNTFKVISSQALTGNRSLHLVEVGRQIFLVGAGEESVNLISEITDKETIDEIRLKLSTQQRWERRNFRNVLLNFFRRQGNGKPPGLSIDESVSFLRNQRERLKRF